MMDSEQKWDKKLNIRTAGRDTSAEDDHHYPYEPTPYPVLERLAGSGWITKANHLIDYGCGKGRVGFFMNYRTGCRCTGVEYSETFCEAARRNLAGFFEKGPVLFEQENAERYVVPADADRFYFFNPFSAEVLRSVISRILLSWYESPREMLLFFYYPSDEYVTYLMGVNEMTFLDEIDCSDLFPEDSRERILCFEVE